MARVSLSIVLFFAWVIAIIMLAGGISILNLPISQYPSIAPPTIGITAQYPGASAQTVQDTVTQVIEQNMNGLDYLLYMSSTSDSFGAGANHPDLQRGRQPGHRRCRFRTNSSSRRPCSRRKCSGRAFPWPSAARTS